MATLLACGNQSAEVGPAQAGAGGQALAPVEKYGRRWLMYAQVNKAGDYFRRMFIEVAAAEAMQATGQLPEGTPVIMETWFGERQSTVYLRQKDGDRVLSGSFAPERPRFSASNDFTCNLCHRRAKDWGHFFTLKMLETALRTQQTVVVRCDEPSFTPCELAVYQP